MGVDHRRGDIAMAEELLHGADVLSALQQMRGERMAQGVTARALRKTSGRHGLFHRTLYDRLVQVMPALGIVLVVFPTRRGRKNPLPWPFRRGIGELAVERRRENDSAKARAEVSVVQFSDLKEMVAQCDVLGARQDRHAIAFSFRVANEDFVAGEVEILDA